MKIEGYEEISLEEHNKLRGYGGLYVDDQDSNKVRYFKKAQKFPIVFEGNDNDIEVQENNIKITSSVDGDYVRLFYDADFPLLVKAVEKAKEVMKKEK